MIYTKLNPACWPGIQNISRLGFGGAAISGEGGGYGFGEISEAESLSLLQEAFEHGINLFDTAPIYGYGLSEKRIGRAFSKSREKVFIVSKGGINWDDSKRVHHSNEPHVIEKMLGDSLRRLGSQWIDLYLVHWPDPRVPLDDTLEVLERAKQRGDIFAWGLSNFQLKDIEEKIYSHNLLAIEDQLNAFTKRSSVPLLALAREHNLLCLGYGTFAQGILSGHLTPEREKRQLFDLSDFRRWAPWWRKEKRECKYKSVVRLETHLCSREHTLLEYAIGTVLENDAVSSALCGVRNSAQLISACSAISHLPESQLITECDLLLAELTSEVDDLTQ